MVKRAAVKTYGSLPAEGKSADEVKTAIAADEKGFNAENVNEIYEEIVNPTSSDDAVGYSVVSEFRDINNFSKIYKVGDDVSGFDDARIKSLLQKGLIEKN